MSTGGAKPPTNHALWLGPVVALFGLLSYFTLFVWTPPLRDFPWLNLLLLALGLGLSVWGLRRAWPRGGWRAVAGVAGTLLSTAAAALFVAYVFVISYDVPSEDLALRVGEPIPEVTLSDHTGAPVELAADEEERVVLVFYRGHW